MRILVTGAFGFLGGRVADALRAKGHAVVLSGRRTPADAERWAASYEVRHVDLVRAASLGKLTRDTDVVVHLAALNENDALKDPDGAASVSVHATARLFDACKENGVTAFVFASTFHVYTNSLDCVIDESTPTAPTHPYALAHLRGERECRERHSEHCRAIILRLSNVYGAPVRLGVDRWTLAHNDFCARAARGEAITLKTSGLQHRDFVWVDDVASGIEFALLSPRAPEPAVFNLGGQHSRSIASLAELVSARAGEMFGTSIAVHRAPPSADEREVPARFSVERLAAFGYRPHECLTAETDRLLRQLAARPPFV